MVGIFGGDIAASTASEMDAIGIEFDWYTKDTICTNPFHLRVKSHGSDSGCGIRTYNRDSFRGAIFGLMYGEPVDEYEDEGELLRAVLEDPDALLAELNGSFSLVLVDTRDDRLVAATDKLGTHPVYYTDEDRFALGTEFKTVLPAISDPTVNESAIGDMLQERDCFIWGNKTFINEIKSIRPATYLVYEAGELGFEEYWDVPSSEPSTSSYAAELLAAYEHATKQSVAKVNGTIGANISGGVDSRLLVSILSEEVEDLHTITYDIHERYDVEPARDVARILEVRNELLQLDYSDFGETLEQGVSMTDAMVPWLDYTNLHYLQHMARSRFDAHVQSHGQGPLFGDHFFWEFQLQGDDPVEILYQLYYQDENYPERLLTSDVDPRRSIQKEVDRDAKGSVESTLLRVNRKNYYTGYHYRREQKQHHCIPTIDVLSNGDILTLAENMPGYFRRHNRLHRLSDIPKFPYITDPVSRIKLDLITERGGGIEDVNYNRTRLPPSKPLWRHTARYLGHRLNVPRMGLGSGGPTKYLQISREDGEFRETLRELIDGISGRPFIDESELQEIATAHFSGAENHLRPIAILTSIESWLQQYYD